MSLSPSFMRAGVVALLVAAPLALSSACGAAGVPASQAVPVGGGAAIGGTGASTPGPASNGISTAITSLGTVVTSDGFTLYRYTKDKAKPPTSTCTGTCATAWPPVLGDGLPAVDGLDPALLGTVGRPDGTQQLTVSGWPVYRFAKDKVPGDVKGQGVGGTWAAVGIDGSPLTGASPTAAPAPAPTVDSPAGDSAPADPPVGGY